MESRGELLEREGGGGDDDPGVQELFEKGRSQSGGFQRAAVPTVLVQTHAKVVTKDVLQRDDLSLHSDDFGDVGDPARAVP